MHGPSIPPPFARWRQLKIAKHTSLTYLWWKFSPKAFQYGSDTVAKFLHTDVMEVARTLKSIRTFFQATEFRPDICPEIFESLQDKSRAGRFHVSLASFDQLATAVLTRSQVYSSFKPILVAYVKGWKRRKSVRQERSAGAGKNDRQKGLACVDALSPLLYPEPWVMQEIFISFATDRERARCFSVDTA